jgi:quercetin dioxygenase-like cupin family protein
VARESSKVVKSEAFRWREVAAETYKGDGEHFKDITRHTLLGERDGEQDLGFVTRYFEVQPGGYSSLERHEHPHAVVILRGRGRVILGGRVHEIAPFDCVYVAPGAFHQFHAGDEPLGFLCVVDRVRDRPQLPSDEEFEALVRDPAVRDLARR